MSNSEFSDKFLRPLTAEQTNTLKKLSSKSLIGWNEEDVRAFYINPIIELLGYEKDTQYDIKQGKTFTLL
jgi:hypothetical protein